MGPEELEAAARRLAERHGAEIRVIAGDNLVTENLPLIHAVGRGSVRAPRLIDLIWGDASAPKVTVVGKGVCFDSGGLDIKDANAMLLMKKDMGAAATALALGHMVMDRGLKVRLRVLIPTVENAVSGSAYRPLDVYPSRKGLTVEIGNTDAEGRLVLADALALADEETPDLLINLGTLTGGARIALGPDIPALYTDDDAGALEIERHGMRENDPVWRMPLWRPYDSMLDSKVADVRNEGASRFASSIVCALFLKRFVEAARTWLHFDLYAWNATAKPGRPEGGECQVARALYAMLTERYGT
jgi:leucyl aminopeptidase